MKRTTKIQFLGLIGLLTALACGCSEQHTYYADAEYIMFADTSSVHMIQQDRATFTVPVASTVACDYDRTFAVEILDSRSNAIEGHHYRLESNTITIPAGSRATDVIVHADYEHLISPDTLSFTLQLVMPEAVKWDLYGTQTNVKMVKSCPFVLDDYTGWCVVTSMVLYNYPGDNTSIQRLIRTEKHPTEENTIILHSLLYDGYDIVIRFETEDPAEPWITMDDDQVLSDEESVFGMIHGDNKILAAASPYYYSYFNTCQHFVSLYLMVYVEDMGQLVGYVETGAYNVLEWVSDEEADRLEREEGIAKH